MYEKVTIYSKISIFIPCLQRDFDIQYPMREMDYYARHKKGRIKCWNSIQN